RHVRALVPGPGGVQRRRGAIARAVKMAKTSDFWALTQTRHLPNETKRFVPQILAATVITQTPSRYGFDVTMETPLAYEEVTVKRALDFETIATLAEVPVEDLRELNPALRAEPRPGGGHRAAVRESHAAGAERQRARVGGRARGDGAEQARSVGAPPHRAQPDPGGDRPPVPDQPAAAGRGQPARGWTAP